MDAGESVISTRWAILRFRFRGPMLALEYRDSVRREPLILRSGFLPQSPFWPLPSLALLDEHLMRLAGPPVSRQGPHSNGPYTIALYYSLPEGIELPEIEQGFLQWLRGRPYFNQIQPVRLSGAKRLRRDLFRLPLRILATGEMYEMAAGLTSAGWLNQPEVLEYGLKVERLEGDLELTLQRGGYDVVLTHESRSAGRVLRRLPEDVRPRLLISSGPEAKLPSIPGVAALDVGMHTPSGILVDFLLGIVHDFPLHEALKAAIRTHPPIVQCSLLADPISNQSLRMREALIYLNRQATRVRAIAGKPPFGRPGYFGFGSPEWSQILALRSMSPETLFHQETTGMVPLANTARSFEVFWRNRALRTPSTKPERRALDAALLRLDSEPWYSEVESNRSLQAGATYDLRVHIGARMEGSLVTGDVTSIDELLAPPDDESGHWLDLSVQAKDFSVLGERAFKARLPRAGSSDPVYFRIRAPRAHGYAELRIYVHRRNHLVQSFLLKANVSETEGVSGTLVVEQEFARSEEFTNLDELQPRALFLGLNQGPGATHRIAIVADSVNDEVNMSAKAFDQAVQDVRQEMRNAILVPGGARTHAPVPHGQPPSQDAADALRKMIRKGRAVYDALLGEVSEAARAALVGIQDKPLQKIQILRFNARSAFPWVLLYDWTHPVQKLNSPDAPVCLGYKLDANGQPVECDHKSGDKVYCVRGFWGIRHYVEELLKEKGNAQPKILKPSSDPVRIVASTNLKEATALETNLKPTISGVATGPWVEQALLDLLWKDPPSRPAVLIVLGHLETQDLNLQPVTPRVELQPGAEWITLAELLQKVGQAPKKWADPRTILVLAPCESAATSDDTLNNFVTAFWTAGAGAILGTQVEVGAVQATHFAEEVTKQLWSGASLGVAMHAIRSEIVMGGDPGGFLFQSFGDIDLELQ